MVDKSKDEIRDAGQSGTPDAVQLRRFEVDICDACINLKGQECHTPGCRFWLCGMAEVSGYLNRLLIRPIIDGKRIEEVLCEVPISAPVPQTKSCLLCNWESDDEKQEHVPEIVDSLTGAYVCKDCVSRARTVTTFGLTVTELGKAAVAYKLEGANSLAAPVPQTNGFAPVTNGQTWTVDQTALAAPVPEPEPETNSECGYCSPFGHEPTCPLIVEPPARKEAVSAGASMPIAEGWKLAAPKDELGTCDKKQYEHAGRHRLIADFGQGLPPFPCKNWKPVAPQASPEPIAGLPKLFSGETAVTFSQKVDKCVSASPEAQISDCNVCAPDCSQCDSEREEFEEWVGRALPSTAVNTRKDARYADPTIEILWQSWQARARLGLSGRAE